LHASRHMREPMHSLLNLTARRFIASITFAAAIALSPAAPAQAQEPAPWSDAEGRASALAAADEIAAAYTEAAIARRIAAAIRTGVRRGHFDGATSGREFAQRLQTTIRTVYDDKHFTVSFRARGAPPSETPLEVSLTRPSDETAIAWGRFVNGGAARAERLAGNVGYLAIDGMPD